jgi:hypothetical protein
MTALYPDWVANQSWLMFGFPERLMNARSCKIEASEIRIVLAKTI